MSSREGKDWGHLIQAVIGKGCLGGVGEHGSCTFRMADFELNKQIARECSEHAEEDNYDNARNDANNGQARWQRQHSIADDLGDHL